MLPSLLKVSCLRSGRLTGVVPVVVPGLCKEDITGVRHAALVYRVQAHHRHVEEDLSSVT